MNVPWHRSLFVRLFAIGAVIALVAVVAATWATVRSTTVAVREEQAQSLHQDAEAYDALVKYAATHTTWDGATSVVTKLASAAGQPITITDLSGAVILDSGGSTTKRDPSRARATVDPLDVDAALLASVEPAAQQPQPVPAACDPAAATAPIQCRSYTVPARTSVDRRVVGPFDRTDRKAWRTLQVAVDQCLAGVGLQPVLALGEDFSAIVGYPEGHAKVTRCVDSSRRDVLTSYVAPPALMFVGSGPQRPSVFFDLSGQSQLRIALLAGLVLLVTLGLSALLAGYVVRPLRAMAAAAQRAGDGDLSAGVPATRRTDEVGEVARSFNRMASRREQLEDARRRLVSDVSHELRTPLANVRGWVEAAQDRVAPLDDKLLESLHEETLHLQRLTDDLHDLSLGDAGELRLAPEPVVLGDFLEQVAESFGSRQIAIEAEPGAEVVADPVRLRQAVVNLVANALRHTPDGIVTLVGTTGRVAVRDTGEGIPADELPHVFDRFRRVDPSRSRATGGTGLGLAIVRQIADAHGGTVTIDSEPGAGTTVTLAFPRG